MAFLLQKKYLRKGCELVLTETEVMLQMWLSQNPTKPIGVFYTVEEEQKATNRWKKEGHGRRMQAAVYRTSRLLLHKPKKIHWLLKSD